VGEIRARNPAEEANPAIISGRLIDDWRTTRKKGLRWEDVERGTGAADGGLVVGIQLVFDDCKGPIDGKRKNEGGDGGDNGE
jgi:hypothetical protein